MSDNDRSHSRLRLARGQSEILGFALLFAVVVSAILVVSLFGTTAIRDAQGFTATESGELAMETVATDFEAVALGSAHSRVSEIALQSGSLRPGPTSTVQVEWRDDPTNPWQPDPDLPASEWQFQPLVYSTESADISYGGSLLMRDQQRGAVAVGHTLFSVSPDTSDANSWSEQTVLPLVLPHSTEVQSVSGGTRSITSRRTETTGTTVAASPLTVRVTVTTVRDRLPVWRSTLIDLDGISESDCTAIPTGTSPTATFSCTFGTERLVVSRTDVSYRID